MLSWNIRFLQRLNINHSEGMADDTDDHLRGGNGFYHQQKPVQNFNGA